MRKGKNVKLIKGGSTSEISRKLGTCILFFCLLDVIGVVGGLVGHGDNINIYL